jgi:hypothetical protein
METKIKKEWFGRIKSTEELHTDSLTWLSEIKFISDEMTFLSHLLSWNYINFLSYGIDKKIESLVKKVAKLRKNCKMLIKLIKKHDSILSELIDAESVIGNKNYFESHKQFEKEIMFLIKKSRRLKKQIFEKVEFVMKQKEQKKLL